MVIFITVIWVEVPNARRAIGLLFHVQTKNDIIQGADKLGQNNVTWGQANSAGVPPNQKSNQS